MFERYAQRLGKIKRSRGFVKALAPSLFTQEPNRERFADVLAPLDSSLNEAYLWHGTTVRRGLAIAQSADSSSAKPSLPPCAVFPLLGASPLEGRLKLPCRLLALSYLAVALIGHDRLTGPAAAAAAATVSTNLPADKMVTVPTTAVVAGVREHEMMNKPATAANVPAAAVKTSGLEPTIPCKPETDAASTAASGDHEDMMPIPGTARALEDITVNEPSTIATTGHTENGDSKKPTAAAIAAATTAAAGEPRSGAGPFSFGSGESERKEHCVDPERPVGSLLRDSSTMLRKPAAVEATEAASALDDTTVNEPGGYLTGHTEGCDLKKPRSEATAAATAAATDEPRSGSMSACKGNGELEREKHRADPERPVGSRLRESSTMLRKPAAAEATEAANDRKDTTVNEPRRIPITGHTGNGNLKKPREAASAAAIAAATDEPRSRSAPACKVNGVIARKQQRADPERPVGGLLRDSSTTLRKPAAAEATEAASALEDTTVNEPRKITIAGHTGDCDLKKPRAESTPAATAAATDEPRSGSMPASKGNGAMLLCRACLGKFFYVTDRDPGAKQKVESGEFDSTVGDRAAAAKTYREIVLYDPDQVYPEYVILYDRLDGGKTVTANDAPFHLELPVYWVNVHRNPIADPFSVHYTVREKIKDLIQRLASGTCSGSKPVVLDVLRVEDSELWNRSVGFKAGLHQRLRNMGETRKLLEDEVDAEEAAGIENMDFALNELLLWHGTDAESATAIAKSGFLSGSAGTVKHGRRFGEGAYFAEDLAKSIGYAPASSAGVRYVLLCRTVCGHIWYTEKFSDTDAHQAAKRSLKHSVLANPDGKGPREYVLFEDTQVYPEYIVQLALGTRHAPTQGGSSTPGWEQCTKQLMEQGTRHACHALFSFVDAPALLVLGLKFATDLSLEWTRQMMLLQQVEWNPQFHLVGCSLVALLLNSWRLLGNFSRTGQMPSRSSRLVPKRCHGRCSPSGNGELRSCLERLSASRVTGVCQKLCGGVLGACVDQFKLRCFLALGMLRFNVLAMGVVFLSLWPCSFLSPSFLGCSGSGGPGGPTPTGMIWKAQKATTFPLGSVLNLLGLLAVFGLVSIPATCEKELLQLGLRALPEAQVEVSTCSQAVGLGFLAYLVLQSLVDWVRGRVFCRALLRSSSSTSSEEDKEEGEEGEEDALPWFCGLLVGHAGFLLWAALDAEADDFVGGLKSCTQLPCLCVMVLQGSLWSFIPRFGSGAISKHLTSSISACLTVFLMPAIFADQGCRIFGVVEAILAAQVVFSAVYYAYSIKHGGAISDINPLLLLSWGVGCALMTGNACFGVSGCPWGLLPPLGGAGLAILAGASAAVGGSAEGTVLGLLAALCFCFGASGCPWRLLPLLGLALLLGASGAAGGLAEEQVDSNNNNNSNNNQNNSNSNNNNKNGNNNRSRLFRGSEGTEKGGSSIASLCVVCLEQRATHACVPCGHRSLCAHCVLALQRQRQQVAEEARRCWEPSSAGAAPRLHHLPQAGARVRAGLRIDCLRSRRVPDAQDLGDGKLEIPEIRSFEAGWRTRNRLMLRSW
ncbi:unnamed protein product [Polarella glacialis]|uniref:Poly [ADP-ribose] polymerase n=1 Tax=Polarella glacialis TaxID=89957 RepID=A0A813KYU8_POLGL|nr:unnamed protein product [Polarella glacialis]